MRSNRRPNSFWAFLLAAALSFGGVSCVATGFELERVDLDVLLVICIGISLVWAIACRYRFGVPVVAIGLTAFWILPNARTLIESQKFVIHEISLAYSSGYGWPVLFWENGVPTADANHALALVACMVSLTVAWVVFRQKKATWAAIAAFLPLAVCLVLTDTVPNSECLMLLLSGLLLLALTNPLRRVDAKQASRATAFLLVPVLLVTMFLFRVAPREGYIPNEGVFSQLEQWLQESELWQWLTDGGPSWYTGDSGADQVHLDTLGGKSESDQVAFYVTADRSDYLYLRGRSYDQYNGRYWSASGNSTGLDNGWGYFYTSDSITVRMKNAREFYYFPGNSGPKGKTSVFVEGMLPNTNKETSYSFPWGTTIAAGTIDSQMRTQCLQLPEETRLWAQQVLSTEVYPGLSQRPAKDAVAQGIANLIRECAEYSLDPDKMPMGTEDFAKWFYTESESGYCVHFATTATVLLRAAGIPARYVTGYALGVMSGSEMAVTQSKAHAWVEYFAAEQGWRILDPTPGYNEVEPPTQPTTEPTTEPTEPSTAPTTSSTDPTEPPTASTHPSEPEPTVGLPPVREEPKENGAWKTVIAVLLWTVLTVAAIWAQYRLRLRVRKWYMHRGGVNQQALARWKSVCLRSCLFRQEPPEQLLFLAEKAKYSQHMLTQEELAAFDRHMEALAAKVTEKPWLIRWLLRLVLAIE